MQNRQTNGQRGYSLAEVLVAIAVFAVVFLAALAIYDRSNRVFRRGVESSNMQQNTRVAFNKLVADLRMAGFDFDRDGVPTGAGSGGTNQYQQPDEQFEYVGPAAITIRGNFDFEREIAPCTATLTDNCDQGREKSYENNYFPVVTTANDEIVTYALVPASLEGVAPASLPACNPLTNCVEFYADTQRPRKAYPDTGGMDESLVQIRGVDLCMDGCNNPPYTLYRFTLARDQSNFVNGANITRTPLASNIRSMRFTYFQDAQGLQVLSDINNAGDFSSGSTIRGLGQYRINSTAAVPERLIRGKINSLRIELIGMNETMDSDFIDAAETVASAQKFRKYRLETLVSPRNIQKRGMREQAAYAPGPPTNVTVCTGACAGVYVSWDAPPESATQGAPDQYQILVDEAGASGWSCSVPVFSGTSAHVFRTSCGTLTPNVQYKFAVVAINDFGSATSAPAYPTATPLNATRANAPTLVSTTNDQNGHVTLTWTRPFTNASGAPSCGPTEINPAEILGYKVERATSNSGPWTMIGSGDFTVSSPHDTVTWDDTTAVNCRNYFYRVSVIEACALNASYNTGGNQALGSSVPSNVLEGSAASEVAPNKPGDLEVDQTLYNPTGLRADARMSWPRVTTDENGDPINVDRYTVYRRQVGETTWAPQTVTANPVNETVTFTDSSVRVFEPSTSTVFQYEYTVTANQCGFESARFEPFRLWPCTFPAGVIGTPPLGASGAFDGDGSGANPFLIVDDASAVLNVIDASRIRQADARVYAEDGTLKRSFAPVGPTGPFTWNWTVDAAATERIAVTVVDVSGCTTVVSAWFSDEAQACCLIPRVEDPTVMTFSAGDDFVDITLKNVCSEQLVLAGIGQVEITWTAPGGGTRITGVIFPAAVGGTVTAPTSNPSNANTPLTVIAPNGTAPVPVGSTNYKVRVTFNRNFTANPISGFDVRYRRASDTTNQECPVVP